MMTRDTHKIIIAGFGGQGVVSAGYILAKAAMLEDRNVTQMVSYGVEMRGGTANSTVIISDHEIASPVVSSPTEAIILNQPSLERFERVAAEGAVFVLNSTLIHKELDRADIEAVQVEASKIADELGEPRVTNIVALGTFIGTTGLLKPQTLEEVIAESFARKGSEIIETNIRAFRAGISVSHQAVGS